MSAPAQRAQTLTVGHAPDERPIAYRHQAGGSGGPTVVWLGGYASDMLGTKAEHLAALAARDGFGFLRFDYSGHGESGGRFEDGTISRWTEEAQAVIATLAGASPVVLVGSSMGAWIALRLIERARATPGALPPVAGLVLIAPAPDFTNRLKAPSLTQDERSTLARDGVLRVPSDYGPEPQIFTRALFEDGEDNRVMDAPIETGCPVTILQGMADTDVPYVHALELVELLPSEGVTLTLVRDGDHRLSRPQDLALIERAVMDLAYPGAESP